LQEQRQCRRRHSQAGGRSDQIRWRCPHPDRHFRDAAGSGEARALRGPEVRTLEHRAVPVQDEKSRDLKQIDMFFNDIVLVLSRLSCR